MEGRPNCNYLEKQRHLNIAKYYCVTYSVIRVMFGALCKGDDK